MEEIRTKKGLHKIYSNLDEFVNDGGKMTKLMQWAFVREEGALQQIKHCTHLQLSSGHVIPIIKLRNIFGKMSVVTPFGMYMIHRHRTRLPSWIYNFEIDMRKFVDLIVDTRNFFFLLWSRFLMNTGTLMATR